MNLYDLFAKTIFFLDDVLWSQPFIIFVLLMGVYFFFKSKFFTIVHFPHIFKYTFGGLFSKEGRERERKKGIISPWEAVCIAVGGCVGSGNIAGVATAIATGGPGAVFWLEVWAFFGMIVKMVEVSLACYYRGTNEKGEYYGGTMYMLEKGVGEEQGHPKLAKLLAVVFAIGFFCIFLGGSQVYSISEVLNRSFGLDMFMVTIVYSVVIYYVIWRGTPRIASFATKFVPSMCVIYLMGGIVLIIANYQNVPQMLLSILKSAFTGSAAVGGFAGATVKTVISKGLSRSINSNEAGQGSSPLVHGSADTIHPIREGLWGAVEVFTDTVIVCTISALAVLCTGAWTTGVTGATLTIDAFSSVFGRGGEVYIGVMMLLFGLTTTSGWFVYYTTVLKWLFKNNPKLREKACQIFKVVFPIPNIVIVWMITRGGYEADLFWAIVDLTLLVPVFTNLISLFLLRNKFWKLLDDYKARYMGIGQYDENFAIFYNENRKSVRKTIDKEECSCAK